MLLLVSVNKFQSYINTNLGAFKASSLQDDSQDADSRKLRHNIEAKRNSNTEVTRSNFCLSHRLKTTTFLRLILSKKVRTHRPKRP